MKLFAWHPQWDGPLSWLVVAETEQAARSAVEAEIARRKALPFSDSDHIGEYECDGWGTDRYSMTVTEAGTVIAHENN